MEPTWLEADGRRLPMSVCGRFGVQFAIYGGDYDAGIFLVSDDSTTCGRISGLASKKDHAVCILWSSGKQMSVGVTAPAFVQAVRKTGTCFVHWRNAWDENIQKGFFPLTIAD